mmetsp:Transcript_32825/g.37993  ORF Transcript_32825/g.37993 Transcript_32825/m.37993 type:complete len:104 (-) Transcript_32825:548-859(-)
MGASSRSRALLGGVEAIVSVPLSVIPGAFSPGGIQTEPPPERNVQHQQSQQKFSNGLIVLGLGMVPIDGFEEPELEALVEGGIAVDVDAVKCVVAGVSVSVTV